MKITTLVIGLLTLNACGKIKTEGHNYHHSDPVKVEVVVNAQILATMAIQADPNLATLVYEKCNGDKLCENKQYQDLLASIQNTMTQLTGNPGAIKGQ